jgi:hypothetical protein
VKNGKAIVWVITKWAAFPKASKSIRPGSRPSPQGAFFAKAGPLFSPNNYDCSITLHNANPSWNETLRNWWFWG